MSLIKSIYITRKPNIAGYSHSSDDLRVRMPADVDEPRYRFELKESYVPGSLAFKAGDELKFEQGDKVVVLNGKSGSGKTTFLRALVNSIQQKRAELISHTGFNNGYGEEFVLKYAEAVFSLRTPLEADTRTEEELYYSLSRCPGFNSQKRRMEFVAKLNKSLPEKSLIECLRLSVFVYEAGVFLVNSGIAMSPFTIGYFGNKPEAWYYAPELSTFKDGSAGQRNFKGLEELFKEVKPESVLCLDDPETSLDAGRKDKLKDHIKAHKGQVFIATHDASFQSLAQKIIDFNRFGVKNHKT